jgi:hypothetical protein
MSDAWKVGKEEKKGIKKTEEYCVLVGIISKDEDEAQVMEYLDELGISGYHSRCSDSKSIYPKDAAPQRQNFRRFR